MGRLLERLLQKTEALAKGMAFDCRQCGQCVLSKTGLVCPMSCPKGLRNGPCGGTLDGRCEVHPERPCVHVRIHGRVAGAGTDCPPLLRPPDPKLFCTSSYLNHLTGRDEPARTPLDYLDLGAERTRQPLQTGSRLEAALKAGEWVMTTELRSPRTATWTKLEAEAALLRGHFHAVNATAYLNGKPSLSSALTAARAVELGCEAIAQATGRDHTRTSFVAELMQHQLGGVHNLLCLTGDCYQGSPAIRQVYELDSSLLLYEARHLRERGVIHFTGQKVANPPRLWLGTAINPYTTPENVPIRRLKQKAAAGADFVQTQLVLDLPGFAAFWQRVRDEGLDRELFLLAGVPVVISAKALEMLPGIPGVRAPEAVLRRLAGSGDLRRDGVALAIETVAALRALGVAGVHLMLFGTDAEALVEVRQGVGRTDQERRGGDRWTEADRGADQPRVQELEGAPRR